MGEKKDLIINLLFIVSVICLAYIVGYNQGMGYQPFEGGFACPAYNDGLLDGYDAALAKYNITTGDGIPQLRAGDIRDLCEKYEIEMDY